MDWSTINAELNALAQNRPFALARCVDAIEGFILGGSPYFGTFIGTTRGGAEAYLVPTRLALVSVRDLAVVIYVLPTSLEVRLARIDDYGGPGESAAWTALQSLVATSP